jgi:hypothetical protein
VEKSWTLWGHYEKAARTSFFGMALAVYIAAETFGSHEHRYKILMCLLILVSAGYLAFKALAARSILGAATALFSLIWVAPIVDTTVFYSVDIWFMLAHSILAMAVAVGAFTYLKN